jgi:membrane dipeptidase
VDLPRMFDGGLDAAFFSIYVAPGYGEGTRAVARARAMIAEVERQVAAHADSVGLARSADDVRRLARTGRKAVLLGLEGGHALAASPDTLRALYELGVRYVTLTHINSNAWADASQAPPRWHGLNDLGRRMIATMNRLGVLVDLAHVSDATFFDALAASQAPVLVSHSSMRALTPSVRNVSDEMLRALAANGGVVMVNFFDAMRCAVACRAPTCTTCGTPSTPCAPNAASPAPRSTTCSITSTTRCKSLVSTTSASAVTSTASSTCLPASPT